MDPAKVKNTISLNGIDCVKGKLVLVWGDCRDEEFHKYGIESHDKTQFAKPAIWCEREANPNMSYTHYISDSGGKLSEIGTVTSEQFIAQYPYYLLVDSENFSPTHLKKISSGEWKDGENIFIECEEREFSDRASESISHDNINFDYFVKLDKDNHLNIITENKNGLR